MKINIFSPVPPTPSAIALQLAAILPALARRAEITLWVHEPSWAQSLEEHATVRRYDPRNLPWDELNVAAHTIYHLGNEPAFHGPIWRVSRQHRGVVILHDLNLQRLFAGMVVDSGLLNRADYLELMDFYHPETGRELGKGFLAGTRTIEEVETVCPLTGAAIEDAAGVAVHTQNALEHLRNFVDVPTAYIPLCGTERSESPTPVSTSREIRRLSIFGFLGANRRLPSVVTALHQLPERERYRLDIYGRVAHEAEFRELLKTLGLTRSVTLHGFVTDEELESALAITDLAINLRDPTMGEASASQLQIWQHGLPSLVTDIGWYATLPDDTVARVRRECEIDDIREHLRRFLDNPAPYHEIGRNGHRYVSEHHTVGAYVDALFQLLAVIPPERSRTAVPWLSERAGHAMQPWFTEETAGVSLPGVARAISDVFDVRPAR